jgi:hypothetical protein
MLWTVKTPTHQVHCCVRPLLRSDSLYSCGYKHVNSLWEHSCELTAPPLCFISSFRRLIQRQHCSTAVISGFHHWTLASSYQKHRSAFRRYLGRRPQREYLGHLCWYQQQFVATITHRHNTDGRGGGQSNFVLLYSHLLFHFFIKINLSRCQKHPALHQYISRNGSKVQRILTSHVVQNECLDLGSGRSVTGEIFRCRFGRRVSRNVSEKTAKNFCLIRKRTQVFQLVNQM